VRLETDAHCDALHDLREIAGAGAGLKGRGEKLDPELATVPRICSRGSASAPIVAC